MLANLTASMHSVRAVTLNNYRTMVCAMGKDGCVESPPEASWQALLATPASPLPVFQDVAPGAVWDAFGAGHDDLLVYDCVGRLVDFLCSAKNCAGARHAADERRRWW